MSATPEFVQLLTFVGLILGFAGYAGIVRRRRQERRDADAATASTMTHIDRVLLLARQTRAT